MAEIENRFHMYATFIHSLNKNLFSVYCVPGTVLDTTGRGKCVGAEVHI